MADQLHNLQHWLLEAIIHPTAANARASEEFILPSNNQTAAQRLAIYQHAYLARLLEVLRELFPCTRYAAGDEIFDQLATGFLNAHAPSSYTLARLADHFPQYLDASRPPDWGQFLVELARLEQSIDRVFDSPGPENLPPFQMPPDADAHLRLALVPGFTMLAFDYPVSTYFTAWKANRQPAWSVKQPQFVAILRRDYIVRRHELTALQFALLTNIRAGLPLGQALAAAVDHSHEPPACLETQIRGWFSVWAASGFFTKTPPPEPIS